MTKRAFTAISGCLAQLCIPMVAQQNSLNIRGALSIGIFNDSGAYFYYGGAIASPGQQWELALGGADPNSAFTLCASRAAHPDSCTPNAGHTDQYGNWVLTGTFDANAIGEWVEWI